MYRLTLKIHLYPITSVCGKQRIFFVNLLVKNRWENSTIMLKLQCYLNVSILTPQFTYYVNVHLLCSWGVVASFLTRVRFFSFLCMWCCYALLHTSDHLISISFKMYLRLKSFTFLSISFKNLLALHAIIPVFKPLHYRHSFLSFYNTNTTSC